MSAKIQIEGGNFQSIIGQLLSNGTLKFVLNQDSIVNSTTEICAGYSIEVTLDSTGNVPDSLGQDLWPNDVLVPSDSFYTLTAYSDLGLVSWGPNPVVISGGSPFDLGTLIPPAVA